MFLIWLYKYLAFKATNINIIMRKMTVCVNKMSRNNSLTHDSDQLNMLMMNNASNKGNAVNLLCL